MLRLPLEVAPLFRDWLDAHYPLRAEHVMSVLRQLRGGRDYDARFGERMRGTGPFAELIEKRFALACQAPRTQPRPHAARHLALSPAGARRARASSTCSSARRREPRGSRPVAERRRYLNAYGEAAVDEARARIVVRRVVASLERDVLVGQRRIGVEQVLDAQRQRDVLEPGVAALQVPQAQRADAAQVAVRVRAARRCRSSGRSCRASPTTGRSPSSAPRSSSSAA